jgi:hypothetical protein
LVGNNFGNILYRNVKHFDFVVLIAQWAYGTALLHIVERIRQRTLRLHGEDILMQTLGKIAKIPKLKDGFTVAAKIGSIQFREMTEKRGANNFFHTDSTMHGHPSVPVFDGHLAVNY